MGRHCSKCKSFKEDTEYYGSGGYCKPCTKEYNRGRYKNSSASVSRQQRLAHEVANSVKTCTGCKVEKDWSEFRKTPNGQHGVNSQCKVCDSKRTAEAKAKRPEHYKRWQDNYNRTYSTNRAKVDPVFRERRTASLITGKFLRKGYSSNGQAELLTGCTRDELIQHLYNTIKDPVTASKWVESGYSGRVLEVDHIVPLSSAKTIGDVHSLMHYTNLQLLTRAENVLKRNSL